MEELYISVNRLRRRFCFAETGRSRKERRSGVDDNGLLARLDSKQEKRLDRSIRYEYDEFDRVAKIDYGRGEIETFRYDSWGKLVEKTQNGRKAEFRYDYFGRLAEKHEEGLSTFYRYDAWGNRTARVTRTSTGLELAEERTYDRYGRLTEIRSDGKSVKYEYDRENRLARQIIDNIPVDFEYTKYNQLAAKYFGGKLQPVSTLRYFYAPDGTIVAREVGGELQRYTYDKRGQLLAVLDAQNRPVEQYTYDKAGNILEKFTNGVRTTFTYDKANQLVSSADSKGNSKKYAYDAAGRLVKEGDRVYQYGWLDKVTQITEGDKVIRSFRYHMDGQLAAAYDGSNTETFLWDGLALIRRDTTNYLNEPAVTGGNPVIAGEKTLFNDLLGSTLGAKSADGFSAIERDAFGEVKPGETADLGINFFTGKPQVEGLGYTFLFRNYRPDQGKWQTADPLGYPDGWNNFAYCNNSVVEYIDFMGGSILGGCDCFFSDCEIVSVSTETKTLSREICFVTTGCQVMDPPSCSDGSHHSVSFTIGLNGNLSFFGGLFTVPIDVSISSNGASHKGQAFTCSKDMPHTPNGGEQTISWFAETKVVVQQTTYECGSVAYSVISEVSGVRKTITKTTQCE